MKTNRRRAWQIERIDTVSMTPEQYTFAVKALAVLIEQWIQELETLSDDNDNTRRDDSPTRRKEYKNGATDRRAA